MALKLMYITNNPDVAQIAESAGVDRIFVDMEYIGKQERQGGMDTVQSHHTIEDIKRIREVIRKADLLARVNPIHNAFAEYSSSEREINEVIEAGADIIMLPYFKTCEEVDRFLKIVDKRIKTQLLLETPEAVQAVDDILKLEGIDEIHIGLNDLSLGYRKKFMFELLTDGTVEKLCFKFKMSGVPYGFGGIASLGQGMLPAECIIKEHYRLGSSCVILSRSFCDTSKIQGLDRIRTIFVEGVQKIRDLEDECRLHSDYFTVNQKMISEIIKKICK